MTIFRSLVLVLLMTASSFATTWTCVKDLQAVEIPYYEVIGTCTPSGTYTTPGGDPIGASAVGTAAAAVLCHDSQQIVVDVILSPSSDGGATAMEVLAFDHTNFRVQCFLAPTPSGAGVPMVECAGTVTPPKFRFRSVCK